ncbi:MAG: RdgB/HAM1 family non-canonical purine NTP pyrophosphatase [Clostridia bacterium]|nr:RdgB/HAM1 family non-canonical purine NTP pyrophosphatase [Clostridia bacterium]
MKKLIVASRNKGKLKEISEILKDFYEVESMDEAGFAVDIEENGKTFYENSLIKARTVSLALRCDALADDSGLCVDTLGGAPGIYSARYGGIHGDDKNNRKVLLENLEGVTDRSAKFVSSVVIHTSDGRIIEGYGETTGKIATEEIGENGFGYDNIFISDDLGKSFGIASDEEKNSVSHRYRALKNLLEQL